MPYLPREKLRALGTCETHGASPDPGKTSIREGDVTLYQTSSALDEEISQGLRSYLTVNGVAEHGRITAEGCPAAFDSETAQWLRGRISEHDVLLSVVSANSLASAWLYWGLGVAEGMKREDAVVLVPLEEAAESVMCKALLTRYAALQVGETQAATVRAPSGQQTILGEWLKARRTAHASAAGARALHYSEAEVHPFHRRGCAGL
jgi:hypothetical protein